MYDCASYKSLHTSALDLTKFKRWILRYEVSITMRGFISGNVCKVLRHSIKLHVQDHKSLLRQV